MGAVARSVYRAPDFRTCASRIYFSELAMQADSWHPPDQNTPLFVPQTLNDGWDFLGLVGSGGGRGGAGLRGFRVS